jgi:hypothetical protein
MLVVADTSPLNYTLRASGNGRPSGGAILGKRYSNLG